MPDIQPQCAEGKSAKLTSCASLGITFQSYGGNCPVQAEGEFDGQPFYFRARGEHWEFHVGPEEDWFTGRDWSIERPFGKWPDAGYMDDETALGFIKEAVEEYRRLPSDSIKDMAGGNQ